MGKPSSVIWVGVGEGELFPADEAKLPAELRKILEEGIGEADVPGFTFEVIDYGDPETADSGPFAGFGVVVHRAWYDAGVVEIDLDDVVARAKALLAEVGSMFQKWGLTIEPRVLTACPYSG